MAQNALDDDRSLERDLKEMLKDGPNMNDISGPVHGGSMPGTETHAVPHSSLSHGKTQRLMLYHTLVSLMVRHRDPCYTTR